MRVLLSMLESKAMFFFKAGALFLSLLKMHLCANVKQAKNLHLKHVKDQTKETVGEFHKVTHHNNNIFFFLRHRFHVPSFNRSKLPNNFDIF